MAGEVVTMHWRWCAFEEMSAAEAYELLAFRQDVFIVEQDSAYRDLDGLDPTCWHLRVRDRPGGALLGCLRAKGPSEDAPALIGRIAVRPDARGGGLGRRLIQEGLAFIGRRHQQADIRLSAQSHLRTYYEGFGFVAEGDPYDDGGIPHVTMWRRSSRE